MDIVINVLRAMVLINTVLAVVTVFRKPRPISDTWAWLLILVFLPVLGFILYLFTGRGLGRKTNKKINRIESEGQENFNKVTKTKDEFIHIVDQNDFNQLQCLFYNLIQAPISKNNNIEIFTTGKEKFASLFKDIDNAKKSVYIEYYSIFMDDLGGELLRRLEKKAEEGVFVRIIYDGSGSMGTKKKHFDKLVSFGGDATSYITSHDSIVKFRLNYHLHRKIAVIDNEVAYNGGFNVGDMYLGKSKKFGNWRDTHLRIVGAGAISLAKTFIEDWNMSVSEDRVLPLDIIYKKPQESAHERSGPFEDVELQAVDSGPNSREETIKAGYIKLINSAKKYVWIQTPYLILDEGIETALKIAAASGVDVRVMIPNKPDHPFVYRASQYYAKNLFNSGISIYNYDNGFLHAKTMVVDDYLSSVGSANQDVRSYQLNFEINTFLYNEGVAKKLKAIYLEDIKESTQLTQEIIDNYSLWLGIKQKFSRLLSPVL